MKKNTLERLRKSINALIEYFHDERMDYYNTPIKKRPDHIYHHFVIVIETLKTLAGMELNR